MSNKPELKNWEQAKFSIDTVRKVSDEHSCVMLYWATEGDGTLLDAVTANMFIKVYDALREETQARVREICSRGCVQFVRTVDKFWEAIR